MKELKKKLTKEFGVTVRRHIGYFQSEKHPRGLIEFLLPQSVSKECFNAESIQLNFGPQHPWGSAFDFVSKANVNINQIARDADGNTLISSALQNGMNNQTMAMNPHRAWNLNDWKKTLKKLEDMREKRPKFKNWDIVRVPQPTFKPSGSFWCTV